MTKIAISTAHSCSVTKLAVLSLKSLVTSSWVSADSLQHTQVTARGALMSARLFLIPGFVPT